MEKHITLLGIFHIVYHAIGALVGIGIFALLTTIAAVADDPDAAVILPIVGTSIAAFFLVLTAPGIIGGIGLLKRRGWARILTLIVGGLGLIDISLGTALGVYTFWALMDDDAVKLFR